MKNVKQTRIFKLSIISSLLLLFVITYGQPLYDALWILSLIIIIPVILFFGIVLISSFIFGLKRRKEYLKSFSPFIINVLFLLIIIALPLNYIRNRIVFFVKESDYNKAYELAIKSHPDSINYNYILPNEYQSLSIGNSPVQVFNKKTEHAVLFYTLQGIPDGQSGFVKVSKAINSDNLISQLFSSIYEKRDLGNNWYYVIGK